MSGIDFGRYSEDYASCRPGFPASFYDRLNAISTISGARVLDIGTGPGTIALELAARAASVTGMDISEELIATATRLAIEKNLEKYTGFKLGRAEDTGFPGNTFDWVTAGQCWHWFDRASAMRECKRILRSDGLLIIAYYSYLAGESDVAGETERLVLRYNPAWTMAGSTGVFPQWIAELEQGGFESIVHFSYVCDEYFSHKRWRGRMRTCNGVGSGDLSPAEVAQFDRELSDLLESNYPDPMNVKHRVWCAKARNP